MSKRRNGLRVRSRCSRQSRRIIAVCVAATIGSGAALVTSPNASASHCVPHAQNPAYNSNGVFGQGYLACSGTAHTTSYTISLQKIDHWGSWLTVMSDSGSFPGNPGSYPVGNFIGYPCYAGVSYRSRLTSTSIDNSAANVFC